LDPWTQNSESGTKKAKMPPKREEIAYSRSWMLFSGWRVLQLGKKPELRSGSEILTYS
jgi:hypothetical protein